MPLTFLKLTVGVVPSMTAAAVKYLFTRRSKRGTASADFSYHLNVEFLKAFLKTARGYTVEAVQNYSAKEVEGEPGDVLVETEIKQNHIDNAAQLLIKQLGPRGIEQVGGSEWWQWRGKAGTLVGDWYETASDYELRKADTSKPSKVILYLHGGAFYLRSTSQVLQSVQGLGSRCHVPIFALKYRLSPQFPFPCALLDAIAAYLAILETHPADQIQICGDGAGAGLALSVLVTLRDQGIPMPNSAMFLSPWVDLTGSLSTISHQDDDDYIPGSGLLHKTSLIWPPLSSDDYDEMIRTSPSLTEPKYRPSPVPDVFFCGKMVKVPRQIHVYCSNSLLMHPLVSPLLQASLGGLPPILIQTGGNENLRDEQIYLACKLSDPVKYAPGKAHMEYQGFLNTADDGDGTDRLAEWENLVGLHQPTETCIQIYEQACHFAQTSFKWTPVAKKMYDEMASFSETMFARALSQLTSISPDQKAADSVVAAASLDDESIPMPSPEILISDVDSELPPQPLFKRDYIPSLPKFELYRHPYTGASVDPSKDPELGSIYLSPMYIPANAIGSFIQTESLQRSLAHIMESEYKTASFDQKLRTKILEGSVSRRRYWYPYKNSIGEYEVPPLTAAVAREPKELRM